MAFRTGENLSVHTAPPMTPDTPSVPVTLILPAFGRQDRLDRALASIAAQTSKPERLIVVDDGSPAGISVDVLRNSGVVVDLARHPQNLGAAAARNTGLRLAESEWVSFLDSDDVLLPDSLEVRWRMVAERAGVRGSERTAFGCGWYDVDLTGQPLSLRWPRPGTSPADFASGCWFSPGSCILIHRRSALETAGYQDENLRRFEDLDWFLALSRHGFSFEPLPVAGVVVERSRSRGMHLIEASAERMRDKWSKLLDDRQLRRRLESYLWLEIAAARYFDGAGASAARALMRSFLRHPRWRLQLSPGWAMERIERIPGDWKSGSTHARESGATG